MLGVFTHISPCGFPAGLRTFSVVKHLFMQDNQQSMHVLLQLHSDIHAVFWELALKDTGLLLLVTAQAPCNSWLCALDGSPLTDTVGVFSSWLILFDPKVTDCISLLPESTIAQAG